MKRRPKLLYCRCAYADVLPEGAKRRVRAAIEKSGTACMEVADLCELAARKDPSLAEFAAGGQVDVIACHERAVRWLFAAAGAPLAPEAVIHDMRKGDAAGITSILSRRACAALAMRSGHTQKPKKPPAWIPWFPVIDYGRCKNCRQCLQFCLFGVYADRDGKVAVVQPDKCKTGCPACARLCPQSAIIFPKYKDGPISGEDGVLAGSAETGMKTDLAALSPDDLRDVLRRRSARAKPKGRPSP
jgi:Pyruvate/2-oxoacid:ferredoxin oxidoreductase delta subunit